MARRIEQTIAPVDAADDARIAAARDSELGAYDRPRSYVDRSCAAATPLKARRSDEIQARLAEQLRVKTPASDRGFERFNIAPTQEVLAVVQDRRGRRDDQSRRATCAVGA